jgi:hypothetical protein
MCARCRYLCVSESGVVGSGADEDGVVEAALPNQKPPVAHYTRIRKYERIHIHGHTRRHRHARTYTKQTHTTTEYDTVDLPQVILIVMLSIEITETRNSAVQTILFTVNMSCN